MSEPVVEAQDLVQVYEAGTTREVRVLRGVDLRVLPGEFLSVVGQSGSGKSTLLNVLGALDVPTSGTVRIDGIDLAGLAPDELADVRNRKVGFIFQFHHLLGEFTCLENALMPLSLRGGTPSKAEVRRVMDLLERVELSDQLHKRPSQMSGGQQQRAAVVRAMAASPRLVLADEPTGNLDSRSGARVFEVLRDVARQEGVAFLMVTHDQRLAGQADRCLRMEDGLLSETSCPLRGD